MDLASIFVVYLLLWWWVFLMSLPFGVRTSDNPLPGHATSAPERPMIWRKVLASTCIAGVLTFVVYWIIASGIFTLGTIEG